MSDTIMSLGALVADLQPYVLTVTSALVGATSIAITALVKRETGVVVSQAMIDKVDAFVMDLASKEIAAAADNLAHAQINVGSEMVKVLTSDALRALPDELTKLGLSPSDVASKIAAAFGRLQAHMTAVTVAPTPAPAPVAPAPSAPMPAAT